MTTATATTNTAHTKTAATKTEQLRVTRRSPAYWRVTIDNPPINIMGPEMVKEFQEVINALETDEDVRVVVFDSAVDDYFLNHSDFTAKLEDLTSMPASVRPGCRRGQTFLCVSPVCQWPPSHSSAVGRPEMAARSRSLAT